MKLHRMLFKRFFVMKWSVIRLNFNEIADFKIFSFFVLLLSYDSSDFILNAISQNWCCLWGVCDWKFEVTCQFLLSYQHNILWKFGDLLIIEVKDISVTCWQVKEKILQVCFLSDDEWKSIDSGIEFNLCYEPIHDGHEFPTTGI